MAVTLDSLKKAIKKNKGRSQALAWLADFERASGDYDEALKHVDEALAASPSDVPAMLVRAKILAGMQDFAGSITEYKKVLSKDPFCLSAHKRMGESFDKLGKTAERNACFRRVHDMDPLDPFWKDEYDVLPEEEQSDLVAPPMDDSSFTMDVGNDAENTEAGEEHDIFANLAASLPNTDEEDNSAMDALRHSLNSASDANSQNGDVAQDASFEGHALNSSEVSSAISDILGGDDDLEDSESGENKEASSSASPFSHMDFSDEEDVQSNDSVLDLDEEPAEAPAEPAAADEILSLDDIDAEEKSTNVNDAFSSIFGDDELPEEKPAESAEAETAESEVAESETAEAPVEGAADEVPAEDVPAEEVATEDAASEELSIEDTPIEEQKEESSEELGGMFEKSADADFSLNDTPEEKPSSVNDAFSSIFGDDELPEEKPAESAESEVAETETAEASVEGAAEEAPAEELSIEDAPAEEQKEESSEELGGLFEKSADGEFSLDEKSDVILKEPDSEFAEEKSEESLELSEEKPAEEPAAEEPVAELAEGSIPSTHMDFSDDEDLSSDDKVFDLEEPPAEEKSDAADIDLTLDEEPAEAPAEEKPAEEELAEAPAEEQPIEDAPAESEAVAPAEETPAEDVSLELSDDELGNGSVPSDHMDFSDEEIMPEEHDPEFKIDNTPLTLDEDAPAEEQTPAEEASAEEEKPIEESAVEETAAEVTPAEESAEKSGISEDLSVSVDGAFDALFGDEDEAPAEEEKAEEAPAEEVAAENETVAEEAPATEEAPTEEKIEESPVLEEPVAEAPADAEPAEDNLAKEMGGAFASMFGDDDDLDLSEEKSETKTEEADLTEPSAEEPLSQEATSAEIEEQSVRDNDFKLESASDFVANESESLFEKSADADFTLNDVADEPAAEPKTESEAETVAETAAEPAEVPSAELDSIGSEVSNAFKGLFDEDDSLPESDEPSNKGVDYLMSGDSDDEVSASLVNDADAPLSRGAADLDDSLNTRTLADIYMEQGVYSKALEIYSDLAKKNPDNEEIKARLEEVQKLCREKFGEN